MPRGSSLGRRRCWFGILGCLGCRPYFCKRLDYFRVSSIQHYLIVRARRREIVHHYRSVDGIVSRIVNLGSIRLDPPGIVLDIGEIYAGAA